MEVFRLSKEAYANKLIASGTANRWNRRGQYVIYTGSSRSLATLEMVVHRSVVKPSILYKVMVISIADDDRLTKQIMIDDLPNNWRGLAAQSKLQMIGTNWYENKETLLLKVPSAVIPKEHNYIINTEHPDFSKCVSLVRTEDYFWDARLF